MTLKQVHIELTHIFNKATLVHSLSKPWELDECAAVREREATLVLRAGPLVQMESHGATCALKVGQGVDDVATLEVLVPGGVWVTLVVLCAAGEARVDATTLLYAARQGVRGT